jgi:chromosome segregation ATPase
MNEQETAEIEIELEPFPDREAHVIRRIIDRSKGSKHGHGRGASTFFINHKEVTAKSIHQLVTETYSIFVDNLCTFLPQERVGNFSALSPHLLLEETEKVLSKNQELYHEHQRLIDLEARIDDGNNNLGTLQAKLKHLEEENARLEREKERMEERERAIQQAKLYRMKLLWLRFDEARDAAIVLKQQRAQALTRLNDAKRQVEPLENNHSLICLQKQKAVDRLELEETNCRALGKSLTTLLEKHEKHDETVEDLLAQVKHLRGNRERRRQDLETARLRLDKLEATIKGYPPRREIVAEYDDAALAKRSGVSIISHTKRNLGSHQQQLRDAEDSARRIQEKLRKLNDDKARRNERIFQLEPKLREVYEWLNQNRARFRRQVWGPIVCEVTTNSQVAATFLEQHVPNVILKAFVVECRDDFDLLYKLVRQGLG